MHAIYSDTQNNSYTKLNLSTVKWAQWDKTKSTELLGLFMCVCTALCTIAAHNTAQNRPDNFPSYPPDSHHCSDDVCLREGRWCPGFVPTLTNCAISPYKYQCLPARASMMYIRKNTGGRGSAPDPSGGAHHTPPDSQVGPQMAGECGNHNLRPRLRYPNYGHLKHGDGHWSHWYFADLFYKLHLTLYCVYMARTEGLKEPSSEWPC